MAADLGSILSSIFPSKQGAVQAAGSSFFYITIIVIIFIFLIAGGIGVWLLIRALQFNKKVHIYDARNGIMEYVGKDRAKEVRYNIQGDTVFFLNKRKMFLPRGEMRVGKNLYLYGIREDGEWINFSITDLNQELRKANIKFIHSDMRAFKAGLSKIMKDRFEKKSSVKDIVLMVAPYVFIIIASIALYFIADRLVAFLNQMPAVIEKLDKLLATMSNVCSPPGFVAK